MSTAASASPRSPRRSTTTQIPTEVVEAAKLHLLDTLGCGLAAHALGVAADARGRRCSSPAATGPATVIGADARPAGRRRGVRQRDASATRSTSTTRTRLRSRTSASRSCRPRSPPPRRRGASGARARSPRSSPATRSSPASAWRRRARSTPAASTPRRSAACSARPPRPRRLARRSTPATTTSALGIAGSLAVGHLRVPRRRLADEAACTPAWAAHGGADRRALAAHGAEGPRTVLEGRFGLYNAFLGAATDVDIESSWPTSARAGRRRASPSSPIPACHYIHASLDATRGARRGALDAGRDRGASSRSCPPAGVALVLEPRADKRAPAHASTRRSSASRTRSPRCSRTGAST